jgi:hypothetical protein
MPREYGIDAFTGTTERNEADENGKKKQKAIWIERR